MNKYILTSLCTAFLVGSSGMVQAASCVSSPSCESLGYIMSASECSGVAAIKCPWDTTKVFCDKDPCADVVAVIIPANGVCNAWSAKCPKKCMGWTCNAGYINDGKRCFKDIGEEIPMPVGCSVGHRRLVCDGREYCCPESLGYVNCSNMNSGIQKCFIKNELEAKI